MKNVITVFLFKIWFCHPLHSVAVRIICDIHQIISFLVGPLTLEQGCQGPCSSPPTSLYWKGVLSLTRPGTGRSMSIYRLFTQNGFEIWDLKLLILNLLLRRFGLVKFVLIWFGLTVWTNLTLLSLILVWFGLVVPQTNKQIIINIICDFVFGYSTDKQTN